MSDEWDEFADPADLTELDESLLPVDVFMRRMIDAWDGTPAHNAYHPADPSRYHRKAGC